MKRDLAAEEELRRQASDWLARLRGPLTDVERAAFARWVADPAHAEAYNRVKAGYDASGLLAGSKLARTRRRLEPRPLVGQPRYALAAGLAALLIIPGALLFVRLDGLFAPADAKTLLFATAIGEVRAVPLPDGTRMTLDTRTDVRVEMDRRERRVTVKTGRARFAVAAEARPFRVDAGKLRVTAQAATFDIAVQAGTASVQPIAGAVLVESVAAGVDAAPRSLQPGQALAITAEGDRSRAGLSSRSGASWPEGMLEFDQTPLGDAVAEANRYSRSEIVLADPSLGSLRVSGTFRAGDLDGLARSLEAAFDLRLSRDGQRFTLHPRQGRRRP